MMTFLTILLAVVIVLNVWLGISTAKLERERRRKYQERMDECDKSIGEVMDELSKTKFHLKEAQSANAALKRSFEETVAEYEKLAKEYEALQKKYDAIHHDKEDPVDAGQPTYHDTPGDPVVKPAKPKRVKKARK